MARSSGARGSRPGLTRAWSLDEPPDRVAQQAHVAVEDRAVVADLMMEAQGDALRLRQVLVQAAGNQLRCVPAVHLLCSEPVHLQALAQRLARAVKKHPGMGRGDAEFLTDFCRRNAEMLAHQEELRGAGGEPGEALLEHLHELLRF